MTLKDKGVELWLGHARWGGEIKEKRIEFSEYFPQLSLMS